MINWVDTDIDAHENKIVRRSLVRAIEVLGAAEAPGPCIAIGFMLPLFQGFGKEGFTSLLEELLRMHNDKGTVYYLTDFHFLVIHQIIQWAVTDHNTAVLTDSPPVLIDSRHTIRVDDVVERLFHDTDFLLTSDEYNSLSPEEREALQMSPELFSICNGLPPHPSELKVVSKPYKRKKKGYSL